MHDDEPDESLAAQHPSNYPSSHGDPSRILPSDQRRAGASARATWPPGFPSVDELKDLNREIHDDAGQPERYALDQPSPLQSRLDAAQDAYASDAPNIIRTAALLAHGIAAAQGFRDGNRRTAYTITKRFLELNGLVHLSPPETPDHMLARYLNQVVVSQVRLYKVPGPEKFEALFLRRLANRKPRADWPH
jgi:prophage maintenance system killer protein